MMTDITLTGMTMKIQVSFVGTVVEKKIITVWMFEILACQMIAFY